MKTSLSIYRLPARLLAALVLAMSFTSIALIGCGGGGSSSPVITLPTISTQPTTQTAVVGAATSLSVSVMGSSLGSSLQYQWYKDGTVISGATSATYSIASAALTDTGSYYVVVASAAGSVTSSTATLTVSTASGTTGGSNVIVN